MTFLEHVKDLAATLHTAQIRVNGEGYFSHLERTARLVSVIGSSNAPSDLTVAAAYLHDSVEDGHITFDALRDNLAPFFTDSAAKIKHYAITNPADQLEIFIETIDRLTRRKGETYFQFIQRVINIGNPKSYRVSNAARMDSMLIKMCDISDNLSDSRHGSRQDKYTFALYILYLKSKEFGFQFTLTDQMAKYIKASL